MGIIQKYIGLHLDKKQEDQALLSVVEDCEEILLDLSLEQIINQFVRELAVTLPFIACITINLDQRFQGADEEARDFEHIEDFLCL